MALTSMDRIEYNPAAAPVYRLSRACRIQPIKRKQRMRSFR